MNVELSLVIPAANESIRLPPFLESVRDYADAVWGGGASEVIVVDDGSTDRLPDVLSEWTQSWPVLRVIRHSAVILAEILVKIKA